MPFKSEKQRKYLFANEPEVAEKFAKDEDSMSARQYDINGWMEIKDNPLSKVGVFEYLGSTIDPMGKLGLDPSSAYNVYRSAEELSSIETIESFKLLPWVDEHTMLGDSDNNLTPPEKKGIEGIIGEEVYFKDGYLLGNIKLFSEELAEKIGNGKNELSCGYRCEYVSEEGIFGDQEYQFIQRAIRGNHLASVPEGRMGPDVAVLDTKLTFTIDSEDFKPMAKDQEKETESKTGDDDMSLGEITSILKTILPQVEGLMDVVNSLKGGGGGEPPMDAEHLEGDMDPDKDLALDAEKTEDEEKEDDKETKSSMDALDSKIKILGTKLEDAKKGNLKSLMREVSQRDSLYSQVSEFTGAFDHKEMTVNELAIYACDKLEMKAIENGHEVSALTGYLANRSKPAAFVLHTLDTKAANSTAVDEYFKKAN